MVYQGREKETARWEHLLVKRHSQHQLDSSIEPWRFLQVVSYIIPVTFFPDLCNHRLVIHDVASQGFLQYRMNPGGAVVLDEVIFIEAVLRQGVLCQEKNHLCYFVGGQVQLLLNYSPVLQKGIVLEFLLEINYPQEVVQLSVDKLWNKFRISEVKGAIVVKPVYPFLLIHIAEGGVTEGRVDGISGIHGDEAQRPVALLGR